MEGEFIIPRAWNVIMLHSFLQMLTVTHLQWIWCRSYAIWNRFAMACCHGSICCFSSWCIYHKGKGLLSLVSCEHFFCSPVSNQVFLSVFSVNRNLFSMMLQSVLRYIWHIFIFIILLNEYPLHQINMECVSLVTFLNTKQ